MTCPLTLRLLNETLQRSCRFALHIDTNSLLHCEALVVKAMPPFLIAVWEQAIQIVTSLEVKTVFLTLHHSLLLHTDVCWLLGGKELSRVYELQDERKQFSTKHNTWSILTMSQGGLSLPTWLTFLAAWKCFTHECRKNLQNSKCAWTGFSSVLLQEELRVALYSLSPSIKRLCA